MLRESRASLFLILLFSIVLGGCGGDAQEAATADVVVVASRELAGTPAASTATHTPLPSPTVPASTPTSTAPSPSLPSSTPVAPSPTPSSAMPTALPSSTSQPTPEPTATPRPLPTAQPSFTATPTIGPVTDLTAIRLTLRKVLSGLDTPVGVANAGNGSGWLFILEKVGRIRIVRGGTLEPVPFLDITSRVGSAQSEQGLLGLAFHPDYAENGFFFVNYTNRQGDTVVARFSVSDSPAQADPASEVILLTVDQPAANHNGGHVAFGPDGYLYIGAGDGGGAGDQFGNGQNGATLLGALLRLDVDRGQPYAVPADNPFAGDPAVRDEIWAMGLRNPWRFAFDGLTGNLFIADVGQNRYEEVNVQPASSPGGQNYGWPVMEAAHCFPQDRSCDQTGLTLPVIEYDHAQGCSITGGYVYRGREFPQLNGIYLFGDYCSGRIWGLAPDGQGGWQVAELLQADIRLSSFGEDEAGELYALDIARGELFKIATPSP